MLMGTINAEKHQQEPEFLFCSGQKTQSDSPCDDSKGKLMKNQTFCLKNMHFDSPETLEDKLVYLVISAPYDEMCMFSSSLHGPCKHLSSKSCLMDSVSSTRNKNS